MKLSLCGEKSCCPMVLTAKNRVEIGEKGNLVRLKKSEWNRLVNLIKEGKIGKL